jgi:hypothetical protein
LEAYQVSSIYGPPVPGSTQGPLAHALAAPGLVDVVCALGYQDAICISSKVTADEAVIALGNAGGKGGTPSAAAGKVTGLNEPINATDEAERTSEQLTGLISTNVPLQSGDPGGPPWQAGSRARTRCTAAWRSRASRTAQSMAPSDAAVPCMPTTISGPSRGPDMTMLRS